MKKSGIALGVLLVGMAVVSFSCTSLSGILGGVQKPSLSMNSMSIKSLDLEGITFGCDYSISNPYDVAFTIAGLNADINYEGSRFTSLSSDNGVTVAARGSQKNSVAFKVPYDAILNFAKSVAGKKTLPFSMDGSVSLDVSNITSLASTGSTFDIPFAKNFDVPVVKPKLSVSNVSVKMPTADTLKNAFINGGMNITRAASLVTSIVTGSPIAEDVFKGIDLDVDMLFDMNVGNEGAAAWEFAVKNCSLKTVAGELADVGPVDGSGTITSSSGTIPMKASLNTLQAGAFIAQLLNKRGSNPVFNIESGLSFPDTKYVKDLPLAYSYEIPLSSIAKK